MHCLADLRALVGQKQGESFIAECHVSFPLGHKRVNVSILIYLRESITLGNDKITFQATFFNPFELALEMRFSRQGRE